MANFSIQSGMSQGEIVGAINYLLANIGLGLQINEKTGQISIPRNTIPFAYAYRYMYFAFANSSDGVVDFSQDPTLGFNYYGLLNTPTLIPGGSTNPIDYVWYKAATTNNTYFYFAVLNPYQLFTYSSTSTLSNLYENYIYYVELINPTVGWDISLTTNPLNGAATTASGSVVVTDALGNITFNPLGQLSSGFATTSTYADNIFINTTTPGQEYYISMGEVIGDFSPLDATTNFKYFTSTTGHIVYTPNIVNNATVTLLPQASAPTNPQAGMMAVSNGTGWDPLSDGLEHLMVYLNGSWTQAA
jgi:hypothetical protein